MHAKRIKEPEVKLELTMTEDEFDTLKDLRMFWNIVGRKGEINSVTLENRFEFPDTDVEKICTVLSDLFKAFDN